VKTRTDFIKTVDDLSAELNGKLILIFDWPFLLDYVKRNGIEKYGMLGVGLKKSIPLSVCTQEALFEWRGGFPSGRHLASLPLEKTNLGIISMRYRRGGLLSIHHLRRNHMPLSLF
jgi:hypothetical protein